MRGQKVDGLILEAFSEVRKAVDTTALAKWHIMSNPQTAEQAVWDPYLMLSFECGSRQTCLTFFAVSDEIANVDSSRLMVEGVDNQTDDVYIIGCNRSIDVEWLTSYLKRLIEWTLGSVDVRWVQIEKELGGS